MTGLFEVIAADQSQQVTAGRKAVALASQRVNEKFSRFLLAATSAEDFDARHNLVYDDMWGIVTATCEETGYEDDKGLFSAIVSSYVQQGQRQFEPQQKTASMQFEARRPKMCPYHSEVTDISLAQGDPKAGYEAMAQHAWSDKHCQGGDYEGGSCNFRREMVTQSWWDDRDKALKERREQREQERAEQAELEQQAEPTELEVEETPEAPVSDSEAPATENDLGPGVDLESPAEALTEAPMGVDGVTAEVPMAMAASFQRLAPGKHHLPGASDKQNSQYEAIKRQCLKEGGSEDECKEKAARIVNSQRGSHEHTGEALKTVDVQQRSGPSPKIDKREWTPENVKQRVQTEGEGSPNPTHEKDVVKPIVVDNNDRRHPGSLTEVGEGATERQDVSRDSGPKPANKHTWPTGELSAVSTTQPDVDANPLQQILESDYEGFVPQALVSRAASQ